MPTDLQIEIPPEKPGDLPPSLPGLPIPLLHQVKLLPAEAVGKTEKKNTGTGKHLLVRRSLEEYINRKSLFDMRF